MTALVMVAGLAAFVALLMVTGMPPAGIVGCVLIWLVAVTIMVGRRRES
jgi:hypothetical protein